MELLPNFDKIVKIIFNKKICDSIILFGSTLNSKNPQDFDIMLYRVKSLYQPIDMLNIIEILDNIEKSFSEISCSFSSAKGRRQNGEYLLSLAPIDVGDIINMPIFFYGLRLNSQYKVLKGVKKPFEVLNKPSKEEFKSYIIREYKFLIEKNDYYDCLKVLLRIALLYHNMKVSKDNLIENFKNNYRFKISTELKELLKNSKYNSSKIKNDLYLLYDFLIKEIFNSKIKVDEVEPAYKLMVELNHKLRKLWEENISMEKIKREILMYQNKYERLI